MLKSFHVAKYILETSGTMSSMKLQKLVYYSQAWSLVWDEAPLFEENFEAWAGGPILPALFQRHKGRFEIDAKLFAEIETSLTARQKQITDNVVSFYSKHTAQQLSDLTHSETPWKDARGETPSGARSQAVITQSAMHEYYSGLSNG